MSQDQVPQRIWDLVFHYAKNVTARANIYNTWLKLRCTNKYIEFPSENRVLTRCMPRLISFAIALSRCAVRETSENFKMKKILAHGGIRSRVLLHARQTRYPLRHEATWMLLFIGEPCPY